MQDSCPVCLNKYGGEFAGMGGPISDLAGDCTMCGRFVVERSARDDYLNQAAPHALSDVQRSRLSHRLRLAADDQSRGVPLLTVAVIKRFLSDGAPGPTPAQQAKNIVRVIGDHVLSTGEPLDQLPTDLYALVGSPSPRAAGKLTIELQNRGLLDGTVANSFGGINLHGADLTLAGWESYEEERKGRTAGDYGFIALQFADPELDSFVLDVVKPACRAIGYTLVDMRDVKEAGVIDNLMRLRIRDAAFVLADLTHDNNGAYWEAGFAEGLGKPVIYLCERSKFEKANTHFDTNHSTTVVWETSEPTAFSNDLTATLRNSLGLFAPT
jgi:hypothetical protein